MAAPLAKIIGVEQGVRPVTEKWWRSVADALSKNQLLVGISRTYQPEEGHLPQPDQSQNVTVNVAKLLTEAQEKLGRWFDVTATKDWGNAGTGGARADVVLDGNVLLKDVPAPFLLFLDKRLIELADSLRKIPTQSLAEDWEPSTEEGVWRTAQVKQASTAKTTSFQVIVPPTDKHPAEIREVSKDVISGWWTTVNYTSAPEQKWLDDVLTRIGRLHEAVTAAVYDANKVEVRDQKVAGAVFGYIFNGSAAK